ncbi:hypothetical protein F1C16_05145 [Hymenobacter sp. NBH84]|uniref:hypothetical protein n=1 Tax=Hymenobacter sp. NBH84 TaxID=2596915 RepID=UPI001624D18A|nr:hypothetical protein [Hymenobacter sp. NBH84]QNE38982.1 hypothetical protein F1C16_05145 [Hymenobacter sp. NBH84]
MADYKQPITQTIILPHVPNKGGRPSKLGPEFINAAEVVLNDNNIILFTDYEVVDEINDKLEPQYRICKSTFEKWKAKAIRDEFDENDAFGPEFLRLIKKALRNQKRFLTMAIQTDSLWQRYAWIGERKFNDLNLKHVTQVDVTTNGESLNKLSDNDLDNELTKLLDK